MSETNKMGTVLIGIGHRDSKWRAVAQMPAGAPWGASEWRDTEEEAERDAEAHADWWRSRGWAVEEMPG